jgi:hypothetical protein
MYSILYRECAYAVCTKMCHCHEYMHSSVAQDLSGRKSTVYNFPEFGGKTKEITRKFSDQHTSNHHKSRAHCT